MGQAFSCCDISIVVPTVLCDFIPLDLESLSTSSFLGYFLISGILHCKAKIEQASGGCRNNLAE